MPTGLDGDGAKRAHLSAWRKHATLPPTHGDTHFFLLIFFYLLIVFSFLCGAVALLFVFMEGSARHARTHKEWRAALVAPIATATTATTIVGAVGQGARIWAGSGRKRERERQTIKKQIKKKSKQRKRQPVGQRMHYQPPPLPPPPLAIQPRRDTRSLTPAKRAPTRPAARRALGAAAAMARHWSACALG